MANPGEALADQVINKVRTADAQTRNPGTTYGFTGTRDAARIFGQALGTPGAMDSMAVAPSRQEGSIVFGVNVLPGKEAEVKEAVKKMGGELFPDSEIGRNGEFTNDIRMPKAAFDQAMQKQFGIPADSNPAGPEIKQGLASPRMMMQSVAPKPN